MLEGHDHEISFIAVSPDDKTIAPGFKDRTLRAWRLELEDGRETIEWVVEKIVGALREARNTLSEVVVVPVAKYYHQAGALPV
ncbi:hypothetical protein BDR06DRAFT_961915 [Suillus hirtellus]|nr:hypothetical protein BDR06DRAFT_961915 [Suillus hirtellus]